MNCYGIPFDEDAYWERRREEYENPKRDPDWQPEPEREWVFLDEELDDLEAEYECKLTELPEGDLLDIVEKITGIVAEAATYDPRMYGIRYEYMAMEA